MSNKYEPIVLEEFFVWVAPDGNMQLMTMAPSEIMCIAVTRMLHKAGIAQSPHEMRMKGFSIKKVIVNIVNAEKDLLAN